MKYKAFSLIEMSICLIVMSLFISMSLATVRTMRHYIQEQKYELVLQNAEATLIGYFRLKKQFPMPDGPLKNTNGVIKGSWPQSLGKLSITLEYYVDERATKPVATLRSFQDNRQTLIKSELMIPFILKINDKMVYMNNAALMAKYCPHELDTPKYIPNPKGIPEFQPN